jgi:hypothetical protein
LACGGVLVDQVRRDRDEDEDKRDVPQSAVGDERDED